MSISDYNEFLNLPKSEQLHFIKEVDFCKLRFGLSKSIYYEEMLLYPYDKGNTSYLSQIYYNWVNNIDEIPLCPVCNANKRVFNKVSLISIGITKTCIDKNCQKKYKSLGISDYYISAEALILSLKEIIDSQVISDYKVFVNLEKSVQLSLKHLVDNSFISKNLHHTQYIEEVKTYPYNIENSNFKTQQYYNWLYDIKEIPVCCICSKGIVKFTKFDINSICYSKTCSQSCAAYYNKANPKLLKVDDSINILQYIDDIKSKQVITDYVTFINCSKEIQKSFIDIIDFSIAVRNIKNSKYCEEIQNTVCDKNNKSFVSQQYYNWLNSIDVLPICSICDLRRVHWAGSRYSYNKTCGKECSAKYMSVNRVYIKKEPLPRVNTLYRCARNDIESCVAFITQNNIIDDYKVFVNCDKSIQKEFSHLVNNRFIIRNIKHSMYYKDMLEYPHDKNNSSKYSQMYYHWINDIKEIPKCLVCNKNNLLFFKSAYLDTCSKTCAVSTRFSLNLTHIEKQIEQLHQQTNNNFVYHSGYKCTSSLINVTNKTCGCTFDVQYGNLRFNKNYCPTHGVITRTNLLVDYWKDDTKKEIHDAIRVKIGKSYTLSKIKEIIEEAKTEDVIPLFEPLDVDQAIVSGKKYQWKHTICGSSYEATPYNYICPICYPALFLDNVSKGHGEIVEYIKTLIPSEDIVINDRKILCGKELDVYIDKYKFAIEYNGVYYHSYNFGKEIDYHYNKSENCDALGISLFHIYEDQWKNKTDIIKSMISNKLQSNERVYARKTIIKVLSPSEAKEFFDSTHLAGHTTASLYYGLIYKDKIVCAMSFSKPRFDKKYQWEIIRFSNALFTSVVGGASKLFNHFMKEVNPQSIMTYSSNDIGNGELYYSLGFAFVSRISGGYCYIDNQCNRYSRHKFQKHKLCDMINYDENKTEKQIMMDSGYLLVHDAGNKKWELVIK